MMYHHDERPYDVAASEAAKEMREKLHQRIESAKESGQKAIERIFNEIPMDNLVNDSATKFRPIENGDGLEAVYAGKIVENIHPHAFTQIAESAGIPRTYLADLQSRGPWGRELAAENLTKIFSHSGERHLVRSVGRQTRGFLSTKYRRIDPRPLLDSFMDVCKEVGALPYEATCTDTKWMVRATLDQVWEPVPGEVIALGVVIHESAYGNGATEVSPWIERMWCTNLATTESQLRRVHIGARLQEGVSWSDETVKADSRLVSLQTQDIIRNELGQTSIKKLCAMVQNAHEKKVDSKRFEDFIKKALSKEEATGVMEAFRGADIEMLPAGNTTWRASNALSWFAHSVQDPERKFEINKLAGQVLAKAA